MGIDTPTGDSRRMDELDRLIEGRWALINRLFEDVDQLVQERDALAGSNGGFFDRLFGRRHRAPAPVGTTTVRRPDVLRGKPATTTERARRNRRMRVAS